MQQSITELNQFLQKLSYQPLQLSVGIHYGPVVMVPVDTAKPNLLLPIGDGVNLVSRVEAANHTIGSNLLISESVLQFVQDKAEIDRGTVLPIGSRAQELGVFELIGIKGDRPAKITQEETTSSLGQRFKSFMQKFGWGKSK
jgi:adenylate cyclase